jgi:hypothetical protein
MYSSSRTRTLPHHGYVHILIMDMCIAVCASDPGSFAVWSRVYARLHASPISPAHVGVPTCPSSWCCASLQLKIRSASAAFVYGASGKVSTAALHHAIFSTRAHVRTWARGQSQRDLTLTCVWEVWRSTHRWRRSALKRRTWPDTWCPRSGGR